MVHIPQSRLPKIRRALICAAMPATLLGLAPVFSSSSAAATTAYVPVSSSVAARTLLGGDEFNGYAGQAINGSLWKSLTGGSGWGNNELETYTSRASNVSLDGKGDLAITARKETYTGSDGISRNWTSARVATRLAVQYGYLESRIYLPKGQGLWPAFWTVGQDILTTGYPYSGEMDIMEALNQMDSVHANLHGPNSIANNVYGMGNGMTPAGGLSGGWHTYGIDWAPDSVTWYLDGKSYAQITKASMPAGYTWEFSKPHLVQLNLAVGGNWPGSPDSTTPSVATMTVDYVRVYSSTTPGVTSTFNWVW